MSADSQVFWKGPPLCRRIAWHLFCSLAVHGGSCWESSVCISSLAWVHGILTVGCRQGCVMKKLTRRQDELFFATLYLFAHEVKWCASRQLVNAPSIPSFTAEQELQKSFRHKTCLKCVYFFFPPLAMQTLPLIPLLLCDTIWKKFGLALLEILLKISSAKMVLHLKWSYIVSENAPDIH